jgi:antitoxin VapB
MAFHVRDPETDSLVRELALRKGVGLTEAIKLAVSDVLKREADIVQERRRRSQEFLADLDKLPRTNFVPDKAFYDSLNDE